MTTKAFFAAAALLVLSAAPLFAQTPAPGGKMAPMAPAAKTALMAPSNTMAPGNAMAPKGVKVNLNSAAAADLDKLPQIGPARAKAIVAARAKAPFKNWDDFVARKVVPSNAETAIKDMVTF